MTLTISSLRAVGMLSTGLLALGMLAACTPAPEPAPEPEPTETALFSSDEEAFAAAEETYQAYTDAVNATDLADPSTFESVYGWVTGTALAPEKEALSLYHAEGLTRTGETSFDTFTPRSASDGEVVADLCIDVSKVDLLDSAGASVLAADRPARAARKVTFVPGSTSTNLQISSNHKPDPGFSC